MPSAQFFLGANTPHGFASYYEGWSDPLRTNRLFIIKGAPGNGKSSFMRRIANALRKKGFEAEEIFCSADPRSLDGVRFPALGVAFVDGTAPHIIEPRYPLAVECYLPLTQFVDDAAISRARADVMRQVEELKKVYTRLTRILSAVKSVQGEQQALTARPETRDKIVRRAQGVIARELGKKTAQTGSGTLHKRFLSAITSGGGLTLWDTVGELASRVYALEDRYLQAHTMLGSILDAALARGLDVYACYDPMEPQRLAHIIIPALSLAFVSCCPAQPCPLETHRRIRLDACIPPGAIKAHRLRLRFLQKTERALLDDAAGLMQEAGAAHDALEELYNSHVDFHAVRVLADAYAEKVVLDFSDDKGAARQTSPT